MHPSTRLDENALQGLWQRLLQGEGNVMASLMQAVFRSLFHYGTKFTTDHELVKDCIQDVFVDVWQHRSSVDGHIPAKAYLMASLRRKIHRKTIKQGYFQPFGEAEELLFQVDFSVQDAIISDEVTRQTAYRVKHLLDLLPKRQQEVIYLKFFHDLDREHIAEVMGVAPQTVSNLLQLALQKLRQYASELPLLYLLLPLLS